MSTVATVARLLKSSGVDDETWKHADEIATDASLVRRLLQTQFPEWALLQIQAVNSTGTDHAIYRLGGDLAARLPRRPSAVLPLHREQTWLPRLAGDLPLEVPSPLAVGEAGEGYPCSWSVCRWLHGETPRFDSLSNLDHFETDLASFIRALQATDAAEAPRPGAQNHGRGAPLSAWSSLIRERLTWLADLEDIDRIAAAWDADSSTPAWYGSPRWIHGDLSLDNFLTRNRRLCGVIDWSCLAGGDPACDLQVAWTILDPIRRRSFRQLMKVDDDTWRRGRAWALAVGVINLSYYRSLSPAIAENGRRAIDAVLQELGP